MDQAWLEIIDRMRVEDAIRMRRISPQIDRLVSKSLKSRKYISLELECPAALRNPTAMASVIGEKAARFYTVKPKVSAQCSHNLQHLKIRPPNEKYVSLPVEIRGRVMQAVNENASKLKRLHIDRCRLSAGAIGSFGELPESIEEIRITNSLINCKECDVATIIRKPFEMFFQKCRKLKVFEISVHPYVFLYYL